MLRSSMWLKIFSNFPVPAIPVNNSYWRGKSSWDICKWGSGCTLRDPDAACPYSHRIKAYLATWTKDRPCPSRVSRSIVFASRRAFTTSNCPLATAPIRGLSPHTALRLGELILGCFSSLRTQQIDNSSTQVELLEIKTPQESFKCCHINVTYWEGLMGPKKGQSNKTWSDEVLTIEGV